MTFFELYCYKKLKRQKSSFGFTLTEILVIVTILAILVTIVLANIGGSREKAQIAKAKAEARQIYNAIIFLETDTELWPGHKYPFELEPGTSNNEICDDDAPNDCAIKFSDTEAGLTGTDGNYPGWRGPYIEAEALIDPWGNEYFFDTDYDIDPDPGVQSWAAVIGSYGPNGIGNNLYDENDPDQDNIIYIINRE